MKFQEFPYSCGAASLINALRCFGNHVSEKRMRKLTETKAEGISEKEIKKA